MRLLNNDDIIEYYLHNPHFILTKCYLPNHFNRTKGEYTFEVIGYPNVLFSIIENKEFVIFENNQEIFTFYTKSVNEAIEKIDFLISHNKKYATVFNVIKTALVAKNVSNNNSLYLVELLNVLAFYKARHTYLNLYKDEAVVSFIGLNIEKEISFTYNKKTAYLNSTKIKMDFLNIVDYIIDNFKMTDKSYYEQKIRSVRLKHLLNES